MAIDLFLVVFALGVLLGLAGRPLVVKLLRRAFALRKQVDELKRDAEK